MANVHVIGLDIAKSVFQLHGLDEAGTTILQKRLTRARLLPFFEKLPPCLVGIEACATSHYWAREIAKFGHEVRLMPAQYVKPYVKRQKNDMADAEAIAEAVTRPTMRFVAPKAPEEQSAMMLHKVRLMLNRQLVMLTNAIRAHMAEFGIVAPVGRRGVDRLLEVIDDAADARLPAAARQCLQMLVAQWKLVKQQILENDRQVLGLARSTELGRRLMEVPGIGPLVASALIACVPDPSVFRCGRNMAAWMGLVPRQNSSGGKERLGSITKAGNRYLRQMLFAGAMAVIRRAMQSTRRTWLVRLIERRKPKVAAIALANKNARIAWAMMMHGERYREPMAVAA
ncbi:IS110 family RNA-guided transposase [Sphingomonas hengshuiensis]|uniref:Transposase n=1 Tax=Sphingomonas hengshuiensis TaxID=1609977 RepID=A0A7U4JBS0_9SPHN|nr:IS110 family transposase [Sphingomonas hengshuiensis]AJP70570.1 transposase [Sphingomonas hengshuiensis]AJP70815.1 transposase [Sphingomonas hengshuiensis]AJP73916.1 transposase [Sphingomonas hengshuiensis]